MFGIDIIRKLFDSNEKQIDKLRATVERINQLEAEYQEVPDADLTTHTARFRERIKAGESLDELLPEAFATIKNACRRLVGKSWEVGGTMQTWEMVPFDVQLIGGMVLHQGKIAEMKTGEGKTLVATLPLYLNALAGKGAHLVTVNDYLARRDSEWMGEVFRFLGLEVACLQHGMNEQERQTAYAADITYATNNELGFDYLRDNMVPDLSLRVQRELFFAIVDEVDSILIDEARTPLIISGQRDESTDWYEKFAQLIPRLDAATDYTLDEKAKSASLTEVGIAKMEKWLGVENLYDADVTLAHYLDSALRAGVLFKHDKDYVVRDGEVIIVDEFTGRLMTGRRYSEGLHQAIEAKEGVAVKKESQTMATITFQNFFRMYDKLSGMTGTAETEAEEFDKIYSLDVVSIPTHHPLQRIDQNDFIYRNQEAKYRAIVNEIKERHEAGQPVLVGTIAVETSELIAQKLQQAGIRHNVLNAKQHERESLIVAEAGKRGAVTIATNMAGRGTDIKLGGSSATPEEKQEILDLGGLYVIGSERHESRRIDNQLRGRSGRQGEPGESRFFVALDDDLMRIFGGERVGNMMQRLGIEDDMPIENKIISNAIENAQKKVEGHNFDIRKHLVKYDDVMNRQREVIYNMRHQVLVRSSSPVTEETEPAETIPLPGASSLLEQFQEQLGEGKFAKFLQAIKEQPDLAHLFLLLMYREIRSVTETFLATTMVGDDWDAKGLIQEFRAILPLDDESVARLSTDLAKHLDTEPIVERLFSVARQGYDLKEEELSPPVMRQAERAILLRTIDRLWVSHLDLMDDLRQGIGLRGYGQRDPLVEYKAEGFRLFSQLLDNIQTTVCKTIFRVGLRVQQQVGSQGDHYRNVKTQGGELESGFRHAQRARSGKEDKPKPIENKGKFADVGRNDLCPCGSGKKFKKCHGKDAD